MADDSTGPPNTYPDIVSAIGNTPLIRLNRLSEHLQASSVWVKLERCNPGGSIKDRIALQMVLEAESNGLLEEGGTIVEATSGNTGIGLAMVAAQRGYRCVFTMPDKMSKEKIDLLRAMGAEVHVCPTAVDKEDPRSYYEVAARLGREIPGGTRDTRGMVSRSILSPIQSIGSLFIDGSRDLAAVWRQDYSFCGHHGDRGDHLWNCPFS